MTGTNDFCEVCQNRGRVIPNVPVGHPAFGKSILCPACSRGIERKRNSILKMSHLDLMADKTFDSFIVDLPGLSVQQLGQLKYAYDAVRGYAESPKNRWLLLHGSVGTGKTHLAAAIGHECVKNGIRTIFATAPDLLDHLRAAYAPNSPMAYDVKFEQMSKIDLLILDDLGAESPTPWAQEKLYQLINYRHSKKLPMIITTNIALERLEPRVASRILDKQLTIQVPFNHPDFRREGEEISGQAIAELADLSRYREMTLETLNLDYQDKYPRFEKGIKAVDTFLTRRNGWLVITGGRGSGKTHIAAAIAREWNSKLHEEVLMGNLAEFMDYLKATFQSDSPVSLDARFKRIRDTGLLVLDDFKILKTTSPWIKEKLFQLLDYRFLKKAPTIIIFDEFYLDPTIDYPLNKSFPELASRIKDTRIVTHIRLDTPDLREPANRLGKS